MCIMSLCVDGNICMHVYGYSGAKTHDRHGLGARIVKQGAYGRQRSQGRRFHFGAIPTNVSLV